MEMKRLFPSLFLIAFTVMFVLHIQTENYLFAGVAGIFIVVDVLTILKKEGNKVD